MLPALNPDDFDDLHEYVKIQIAAGFAPVDEIVSDAIDVFADTTPDYRALRNAAQAIADRALSAHLAAQAAWPETTDCDRLDAAFAELDESGIVARQNFSCCATCGSDEIKLEMSQNEKAGRPTRGFTFFHMQDTEQAIAGESLYLSYGCTTKDQTASVAIGHEVVAALDRHGLAPAWNGKFAHRIALPLHWQRRRP